MARAQQKHDQTQDEDVEVNGAWEADDLTVSGFTVTRKRLLRELMVNGREAGITIVCAPHGMGKTALLLQYAAMVKNDPSRGYAEVIDAETWDALDVLKRLDALMEDFPGRMSPLVVIDNMPVLRESALEAIPRRLRSLREGGAEVVVACRPDNRGFVRTMGDTCKIGAQVLRVHPQEYPEWMKAFSIAKTLDVYGLTQGVPYLVAMLQIVTKLEDDDVLNRGIANLYRSALEEMRVTRSPLLRWACVFLLAGHGCVGDFERCGMKMRSETFERFVREYPFFGLEMQRRAFCCMGHGKALDDVKREVAKAAPVLALKAVRALLASGEVDRAVELARLVLDGSAMLEVIGAYPSAFALSGNGMFAHEVVANVQAEQVATVHAGVVLAIYESALTMGEYRVARSMCVELRRRAHDLEQDVDAREWGIALALSRVWGTCTGVDLPHLSTEYLKDVERSDTYRRLQRHAVFYEALLTSVEGPCGADVPECQDVYEGERIDVTSILLTCDRLLIDALHGEIGDAVSLDRKLHDLANRLMSRHLVPLAARVRMTAATCRIMSGRAVIDERAFTDAGTTAVRESDFGTQLFCLLGEGWQAMEAGQVVNARFRAQQVLKLAEHSWGLLRAWALLLERAAAIVNTSRIVLGEEADTMDLAREDCDIAEAWCMTMHLSAAHYDAELSAWFSLHKDEMLDERFCPLARQALLVIGDRAESVRHLLPKRAQPKYLMSSAADEGIDLFETVGSSRSEVGQVCLGLFGGFKAERNGHVLTDTAWRRKKANVLAARLALAAGSFVTRTALYEELWPGVSYKRARESLYVTLSSLRRAFGQHGSGPQYVLTQGDGVALNMDYVSSDTMHFDWLARDILLRTGNASGRQIVEMCLKLEEMYIGPLFVPEAKEVRFFERMRRAYQNKFVDCMIRGIEVALELDDVPSASWLIEAALREAPLREDVIRCAMRIYDMSGRRREVVELYSGHLHRLERELKTIPEEETRIAYEAIIAKSKMSSML